MVEGPSMTPLEEKIAKRRRNEIAIGERLCEIVKEAVFGAQPLYIRAKNQQAH